MMGTHRTHVPRDDSAVACCESFVQDVARENDLTQSVVLRLQLVLEELVTNFSKYNPEGTRDILLTLDVDDTRARLRVQDFDVHDYDVTQHPPPDLSLPPSERPTGGLGIHLVRKLTDSFEYQHADGVTTILTTLSLESPSARDKI